jgi:flagellar operon protein
MLNSFNVATGVQPAQPGRTVPGGPSKPSGSFKDVLTKETQRRDALTVSSHAQKRLSSSQVELTDSHLERIGDAMERARAKGSNQSLIVMDDMALVVSVKNRVVITAVDGARMKEGVFTNIDSVVVA